MTQSTRPARPTGYGQLSRHPLSILATAGVLLATMVATLATLPRPDWHYPAGAIAVATPGPLYVTLAALATAAIGVGIVMGGRRQVGR